MSIVHISSVATALTLIAATAAAAPVVTAATIRIVVMSPTSCEVTMALRLDGASEIEHRIESFDGSDVDLQELRGARSASEPRQVGRTRVLTLQLDRPDYELRYRATQNADRRGPLSALDPGSADDRTTRDGADRRAAAGRQPPGRNHAGTGLDRIDRDHQDRPRPGIRARTVLCRWRNGRLESTAGHGRRDGRDLRGGERHLGVAPPASRRASRGLT